MDMNHHSEPEFEDELTEDEMDDDDQLILGLCLPSVMQAEHELLLREEIESSLSSSISTTTTTTTKSEPKKRGRKPKLQNHSSLEDRFIDLLKPKKRGRKPKPQKELLLDEDESLLDDEFDYIFKPKPEPKVNIYALSYCPRELRSFRSGSRCVVSSISTERPTRKIRFTNGYDLRRTFDISTVVKSINGYPVGYCQN